MAIDIKVFWHKSPDTDCICSAIVFADYLNQKWYNATAYKLWNLNKETEFLLNKLWVEAPETIETLEEWSRIALVDHNESSQSIDNLDKLDVEFLVDHHKIDFSTKAPVNIRMEKLCSTASIVYKMYKEAWLELSQTNAKLLLSALLSDSLLFKSATTTKEDTILAEELNKIAEFVDYKEHAIEMFNAKSDLWDISIEELIKYDYKEFDLNWTKCWVWTLETTNPDYALWRKEEILEWMKEIKEKDWLDFILLSIVDIIDEKNISIVLDWFESEVISEVFNTKVIDNEADLKHRLSRKKQIIPDLTEYFNKK